MKKRLNVVTGILDFLCPFKVALEVFHDRVLESLGRRVAYDVYPGTSSLCLLEKMENKTNRSNAELFLFSSLESELSFDSEDSDISSDRVRTTTTVNSML